MKTNIIIQGDSLTELKKLPDESINCCMTSPPYFNQRDYGINGQIGLEKTPEEYVNNLCNIFDEVKRILKNDGSCWVNLGDCYGGHQGKNNGYPDRKQERASIPQIKRDSKTAKSLLCVPELFLIEMIKRGWLIRNKIIWWKPNVMPTSAKDRFTIDYEMLYFFVKNKKYFFNKQLEPLSESSLKDPRIDKGREEHIGKSATGIYSMNVTVIKSEGRNMRTVWKINTKPNREEHFAMYPEELCETPIKAGCPEFVCNKCGKAREKITEIISGKGEGKPYDANRPDGYIMDGRNRKSEHIEKGYTDCNCQAGFSSGIVLDPFLGSGTTGLVALKQNKQFIGIELNKKYIEIAMKRLKPYLGQKKLE